MQLARLRETNMLRALDQGKKYGYMLISADHQPDLNSPKEEIEEQKLKNKKKSHELEDEISAAGFSFIPVYGGYRPEGVKNPSEEKSYFVLNMSYVDHQPIDTDLFNDLAIQLCKEYDQESVLIYNPKTDIANYYDQDGMPSDLNFVGIKLNDKGQPFYTSFKKGRPEFNKADRRFTYISKKPDEDESEDNENKKNSVDIEEVLKEAYVPRYQTIMGKQCHSLRGEIILPDDCYPKNKDAWLELKD